MREIKDYCIVKVTESMNEKTGFKGLDGKDIVADTSFNQARFTTNCGVVVATPLVISRMPILGTGEYIGLPSYHENAPMNFKSNSDIQMEVQVGDKIYFHYNCLKPDNPISDYNSKYWKTISEEENGKIVKYRLYRVNYGSVYAAIRYKKINEVTPDFEWWMESKLSPVKIDGVADRYQFDDTDNWYEKTVDMIGSWAFVEPDYETWDDILRPIPELGHGGVPMLNLDGSIKMKPKEQWLAVKAQPERRYLFGWIRFVGSPLIGDEKELSVGDYVMYRPNTDTHIAFEGEDYHRMLQRNIVGIIPYTKQLATA